MVNKKKCACVICSFALTGTLAYGCVPSSAMTSAQGSSSTSATPARTYITSVHQAFSSIDEQMESIEKAITASDSATVYTVLDKIDQQVGDLQNIDVPSGLEEVQSKYASASKELATALRDYADYRLKDGFQASDAQTKLAAIQASYSEGIAALKAADEAVQKL